MLIPFIITALVVLLVLSLILIPAYGLPPRIHTMPQDTQIHLMCSLLDEEPYYDCDHKWVLYLIPSVYDVYEYCYPNSKSFHIVVLGCATYDDEKAHFMIIGNQLHEKSHTGHSVLEHELLHMKCRCNFHES